MKPEFLIIGSMKAGTSTLRDHLCNHKDVFVAPQELHYFSDEKCFARGPQWYESQFEPGQASSIRGEKTASYCSSTIAAQRIRDILPDVKLIWLFREPVARSYSHYWHSVQRGREPRRFADAIEAERKQLLDRRRNYLSRSRYAEQVELWLELFPRNQIHFVLFEDLIKKTVPTVKKVLGFLDLSCELYTPKERHKHPTYGPRNPRVQWLTARLFGRGDRCWNAIQRLNRRRKPGYPDMDPDVKAELYSYFSRHNSHLMELTGLDLSPWKGLVDRSQGRAEEACTGQGTAG